MNEVGKLLVIAGILLVVVGGLLWAGVGKGWFGRLPGDIHYSNAKGTFHFYFPLATCLLIGVLLTLILWLFRK